ncbi:MAG: DNRLRE domain-containing protein, partial [Thermoplasmatota archaeon]
TFLMKMPITLSAPPPEPVIHTAYFYSDESSYVYQWTPTQNYNTGSDQFRLLIGQDEAMYDFISFVKFSTIEIPDDAVIKTARIRLWCIDFGSNPNAYISMYKVNQPWNENTLTWDNQPLASELVFSRNVGSEGPYDWTATNLVSQWVNSPSSNYGVAFKQTDQFFSTPFYSDEIYYYGPRLEIVYETLSGEEPQDPLPPPPTDTTPCTIDYSITPSIPQVGDEVTISVTATDDIAMQYVSILKAGVEVKTCFAEGNQTMLNCSYSEIFTTPGRYTFSIIADDRGTSPPQGETFDIVVFGTGSNPIVTLSIRIQEDNAIPAKYGLLPYDGQVITIIATATDPDGITMMTITIDGTPYDFTYNPAQTSVEEIIYFINGVDVLTDIALPYTFRTYVRAYDTEGRSTRIDGEDIEIHAPWQWYWGLPFGNWGCDENHTWDWSMMESIYGMNEVYWNVRTGWRNPRAERLYEKRVQTGGRGGHCYGMSVFALELSRPGARIYANLVQDNATSIDGLEQQNWNYTWRYYYARQTGQSSKEIQSEKSSQFSDQNGLSTTRSSGLHPHMEDILNAIIDDLHDGNPGVIAIYTDGAGHAVVPWMVIPGEGDTPTRIYIYDPNRPHASTHDSTDYTNTGHYPFIECGVDSMYDGWWSYVWNSTSTWDEHIFYFPYDLTVGNIREINYIGPSVGITDQRLPTLAQITAMGSGDTTFYAEDATGKKTGYVNGELVVNIPYSAPIFEFAGKDDLVDMFMFPSNISLTFHMESTVESEDDTGMYSLILWDNSSFYALENVTTTKNTKDAVTFSPRPSQASIADYTFGFRRGDITMLTEDTPPEEEEVPQSPLPFEYTITIAKEFYNSPKLVGREYKFGSYQNTKDAEIELYISDDYNGLVVETFDTPFSFSVTTRSTESLDDEPDIEYIPQSTDTFIMDEFDKKMIAPVDWASTSSSGALASTQDFEESSSPKDELDQTPGFEVLLCILALAVIVVIKRREQ